MAEAKKETKVPATSGNFIDKEATLEVSRTAFGKEEVSQEKLFVRLFQTNPANLSVKAGATINLGNYESARVDVMLSVPMYMEEIDEMYPKVKKWVEEKVGAEYAELTAQAKKRKGD